MSESSDLYMSSALYSKAESISIGSRIDFSSSSISCLILLL